MAVLLSSLISTRDLVLQSYSSLLLSQSIRLLNVLCCLLIVVVSTACTHVSTPEATASEIKSFSHAINALSENVLPEDASQTSQLLYNAAVELADEYRMMSPPSYHNMLVNLGVRKRGLCCHWAEDLHAKLRELNASSLTFAWLVAHQGNTFREHNTVVIYAVGSTWAKGMVFDPWRKAGSPYWTKVEGDKYPWQLHPLSGQWDLLRCK